MNNTILKFLLIILVFIFCFSLFKNISYPLLWNDESLTAMFGKCILKYGFPKVHCGNNVIYHTFHPDFKLGIFKDTDAYIDGGWLQYYYSIFGTKLSELTEDIYSKTAIVRIPFALIGFIGLLIMIYILTKFLDNSKGKLIITALFLLFEILSVSLVLHLREVRYYSLVIFFYSLLIYFYTRYYFFRNISYKKYCLFLILLMILLLNTSNLHFFIFPATIILIEVFKLIIGIYKHKQISEYFKKFFKSILPIIITLIVSIPFIIFYKVGPISRSLSEIKNFNFQIYLTHIITMLRFFYQWEFLYLVLIIKIFLIYLIFFKKKSFNGDKKLLDFSNFLTLIFLVSIVIIARAPYFFERYFIFLQPILIIILLVDLYLIYKEIQLEKRTYFIIFTLIIFIIGAGLKIDLVKKHFNELVVPYLGPVDYTIGFIKDNYPQPEKLVIATNYEETAYMYYLNSKTIFGFVPVNLDADLREKPDIIIPRRYQFLSSTAAIFNYFLQKDKYKPIKFPIRDYFVNNIPELSSHLFKTSLVEDNSQGLMILIKEKDNFNQPFR